VLDMSFSTFTARIGEDSDHADRRRRDRHPVEVEAPMRQLGENGVEARILNISEHGIMAQSEGAFEIGSRVWLLLPGRERANAEVKWVAGDRIGAEFAEPISLDDIQAD
jgi:hypothetical protein